MSALSRWPSILASLLLASSETPWEGEDIARESLSLLQTKMLVQETHMSELGADVSSAEKVNLQKSAKRPTFVDAVSLPGANAILLDTDVSLADKVNVLAGTNSTDRFSRGNTLPLLAKPWGFNHWAVQSRGSPNFWFHPDDTTFHGIRCTHQPSPWIGDYGHFLIYPVLDEDYPDEHLHYDSSAATFKPHLFSTTLSSLSGEIGFEMVPSMHGAMIRISFPKNRSGSLLFKLPNTDAAGAWTQRDNHVIGGGFSDVTRGDYMYVVVETLMDEAVSWNLHNGVAKLKFNALCRKTASAVIRLATSFISGVQAWTNLQQELAGKSFESLLAESRGDWHELLSRVKVNFAEEDRSNVFYTNLYRGLLFPRFLMEHDNNGEMVHRSAYSGEVRQGRAVTDEGFWDVYRTHYPMLSLLYPDKLGEIIDGWVSAYKERGWLPTWSSFNQRTCMVGTMGDCSLADAIVKSSQGLMTGFDREKAFEAVFKDATVEPEAAALDQDLGRAGLRAYVERGYAPSDEPRIKRHAGEQSAALTLNYNLADACISYAADALGRKEDAKMLRKRSESFRNIFDNSTKYFRPRTLRGSWDGVFNPVSWGNGFTEASASQYRFYAPHDVTGMMKLMGGRAEFCHDIRSMFLSKAEFEPGSYGDVIHEMSEAQEVGMKFGLYAHNNQPVHDVLYVAAVGGCRSMSQSKLRQVMRELYTKDGWCGDEDNGEMSSWYVLSALGLYSLVPGSDDLVLGSPEVTQAVLEIPGRPLLTIAAPGNSPEAVFVEGVELNGKAIEEVTVSYSTLARDGGRLLFKMSSTPMSEM